MAYSSALVTAGSGRGLVVGTGVETEIGRIHQLVGEAAGVATPLTRKLTRFSQWLTGVIIALAAVTFGIGVLRGESAAEMVTAAVALAVGAIPEGLPAAVTITLAIGVSRMAGRHAIIRKLPAAETLGSTTVICTDKTGTLTQNRMTVRYVYAGGVTHDIDGPRDDVMESCLVAGARATTPSTPPMPRAIRPTSAIRPRRRCSPRRSRRASTRRIGWRGGHASTRSRSAPIAGSWRLCTTYPTRPRTRPGQGGPRAGPPAMRGECGAQGLAEPLDRMAVEERLADFGARALRVLAFASGQVPKDWGFTGERLPEDSLTFLGLQAMDDPPRPEAIQAVAACHRAGISVKMITGDHARTAQAIARQIGLGRADGLDPTVMTGEQMAAVDLDALTEAIQAVDVFARVSAEQKLRLVEALQRAGHVVAMTGDGINDAPALKQADIGIAMGQGGTEVAKEASAMVLVDDNFATIEAAVEEGRGVFDNLTKFITWTLPTNLGEGLVVLAAVVAGVALPILPVQILWINMTTAVALGLMLAFEPAEPDIMARPPRPPKQPILTGILVRRIVIVGTLMLIGAFGTYEIALASGATLEQARTVAVNAFVAMEIGYLFNCRALDRSVASVGLLSNRLLLLGVGVMIALQIALTYLPFMNTAFQTAPLPASDWILVAVLGGVVFFVVGAEKWITARIRQHRHRAMAPRASHTESTHG